MDTRTCWDCKEPKPLDAGSFYVNAACVGGFQKRCVECSKKASRKRNADKKAEIAAYERERNKRPERKKQRAASQERYRQRNPDKKRARNAVNNAIRDGKMTRHPCGVCGEKKAQAHHHDYSKPLDIRWLCFKCHREGEHGQRVLD